MSMEQVIARIQEKNIGVLLEGGELVIRAPRGAMDADTESLLKQYKQSLIEMLQTGNDHSIRIKSAFPSVKITPDKLPLIELSQTNINRIVESVPGGASNIQDIYPLSPLQSGILFHHLMDTKGDTYLLRSILAFDSREGMDRFVAALQQVIERHDILRTSVVWQDLPQPVQVVCRKALLPVHELAAPSGDALTSLLTASDPGRVRLDLGKAPLLAAYVIAGPQNGEWLLALLNHHIVCDHISLEFIISEIHLLLNGRANELPPTFPYRNFIAQLRLQEPDKHEGYFREQLGDIKEPTAPFGILDIKNCGEIAEAQTAIADSLTGRIQIQIKRCGVSAAVLFHLAWGRVLAQCCGQDDVVFGTVLTGRMRGGAGIERTVGMFINTLPLRISAGDASVGKALADTQRQLTGLIEHEQASLALAQRCSGLDSGLPLFTSLLNYRHSQRDVNNSENSWPGMRVVAGGEERTNYPMTLSVDDFGDGYALTLQCVRRLQPDRLNEYMLTSLESIVSALETHPQLPIRAITVVGDDERRQVLHDWNATEVAYPQDRCIHQLFETQVETSPDAIALSFEDNHLTYAELNAKANQLAHYLIERGVGPDVLVGICLERSLEMVIGLLGILKAGGAYVPLDPNYPAERRALILADAGVTLLLTREALNAELAADQLGDANPMDLKTTSDSVVYLDRDGPAIAGYPATNPTVNLHPLHLAYLIYTSGSTGRPKGVAVNHRNAVHSTWARLTGYPEPVKAYLLLSSFAFDSSVAGIFWTLAQGGCLYLPHDDDSKDPVALAALIEQGRISHLLALPSLYAVLLEQAPHALSSLQVAIVAGEACPTDVVKRHLAVLPDAKLYNEYGPTEGTVWSSVYLAGADDLGRPLAIGRPIANACLYNLDRSLNPIPVGVPGELYIGGAGIVPGYWQRPELTAERFVPDPFGPAGGRLYKTGDLVRYRADGALEFLGRLDHQVKIRGFRIELGEIEAQLLQQPAIKDAVVVAREDQPGDKRLVAYVVPLTTEADAEAERGLAEHLKTALKHHLPDYMVPSAFVVLDAMPLSANGKLDRKQLPVPDWHARMAASYEAPRTDTEQALAQIWQSLLRLERVGRHDHFFELGGDSILSIQVVSRARQAGLVFTPKQLFERPTLAGLAEVVAHAGQPLAEQGPVSGNVPLTPIQHWFFEQDFAQPQHWNQALRLRVQPGLTPDLLASALSVLITHHDALRLRFEPDGRTWRQTNQSKDQQTVLTVADLSALPDEQRRAAIAAQTAACQASLDLAKGPLLRAVWFDLGGGERQLLIAIHHLAVDGVSWRILLEDLNTVCRQGLAQRNLSLPAKTTAFKHWAERLAQRAANGDFNGQADYWLDPRRQQSLSLPVDHPDGANRVELEDSIELCLDSAQTSALLHDVPAAYRTQIDDVLLTALALALRDEFGATADNGRSSEAMPAMSGPTYLLIDRESHGREHLADDLDVSRTVGWFTNVYPLLLTVETNDTPIDTLKRIKEQLRAVPENGLGYGLLRYLSTDTNLRQALNMQPAARIIFNYLGQLDTALDGDTLFEACADAVGPSREPSSVRPHELDVVAHIQTGQLRLSWRYSRERYRRATLDRWAGRYLTHLQTLIEHCRRSDVGGYTPSDFPLAGLDQAQLDELAFAPRQVDDLYPLTPLQHGLLFHSRYQPDTQAYRIQLACRLNGPLNTTAFRQAWQHLLARHAILRTGFLERGLPQPLQRVERHARLPIVEHDWRDLSEEEQQTRWEALQADDRRQGYDFEQAPLMRVNLVACADDCHYLLWSYHHVLLDGWSSPILIEELFRLYRGLAEGHAAELAPARPFRDYVAWLQNQDHNNARGYWKDVLAGFDTPTVLGVERTLGRQGVGDTRKRSLSLTKEETHDLQHFVKRKQLTLNTLAQAAWGLLLSSYSGSDDVVFGVTVSGRPAELIGIEDRVGLFINILPMRVRIERQSRLDDWLHDLFEQNHDMRRYGYALQMRLQKCSDIDHSQNLFDTLLVFENYPLDETLMQIDGPLKIDEVRAIDINHFPLSLVLFPGPELRMELSYDSFRFADDSVCAVLTHLRQFLIALAGESQLLLGDLPRL